MFWHSKAIVLLVLSETVLVLVIEATMTDYLFDHDRLDVYRLSIEYVANAFDTSRLLAGLHRHARDQWLRGAQSIPLNIAEGNGKRGLKDRARFLDIARGSALECAAIQDVLVVSGGLNRETSCKLKSRLGRIVAMLTRMAMKFDGVSDSLVEYTLGVDYEHEHRDAEHEHEEMPEQNDAAELQMSCAHIRRSVAATG
jgi:four helix bundle protein